MEKGERRYGISGSTLKLIAIITMLIDHIAAVILQRVLLSGSRGGGMGMTPAIAWLGDYDTVYLIYSNMRNIGRIAFPIFCFLLVEGFLHTGNKLKYALRLLMFAIISEVPFDLAVTGSPYNLAYQNVFFTLLLGLLTMIACEAVTKSGLHTVVKTLLFAGSFFCGMFAASILNTDYAARGVLCIMVLYVFREKRIWQIAAGCLSFFWWELPAVIAFLPIGLYNGKRGWNIKYFFYAFYPLHLLLLYLICWWMGLGELMMWTW